MFGTSMFRNVNYNLKIVCYCKNYAEENEEPTLRIEFYVLIFYP